MAPVKLTATTRLPMVCPTAAKGSRAGPGGGVNCEDTFYDYTQVIAVYVADYPA